MSVDTLITETFEQWLGGEAGPARVRGVENHEPVRPLWEALAQSGFANLLLPESLGGAQASLATLFRVLLSCGSSALPVPLHTTIWVRAALHRQALGIPEGPIALACGHRDGGRILCSAVPFAATAQWVLADLGDEALLLPLARAEVGSPGIHATLRRDLSWSNEPVDTLHLVRDQDWQAVGAAMSAALIAGAASRILQMTLEYANDRSQFGKPIGKFQALQQQISVMAEEVFAARMAAELVWRGTALPSRASAAIAKARTGEAVTRIAGIAHGVFGAIGITEECDLQLFTRRLHEWRGDFGSEAFWQQEIGKALLASGDDVLTYVLGQTSAARQVADMRPASGGIAHE